MKTAFIKLQCRAITDCNSIIAQLNHLAAHKDPDTVPFSRFLHAASREMTTGIAVTLSDCTKKEAVIALRDILRMYKTFRLTGNVSFDDPLTKKRIKIVSLPIDWDCPSSQEELDKTNKLCHAHFTDEDLVII